MSTQKELDNIRTAIECLRSVERRLLLDTSHPGMVTANDLLKDSRPVTDTPTNPDWAKTLLEQRPAHVYGQVFFFDKPNGEEALPLGSQGVMHCMDLVVPPDSLQYKTVSDFVANASEVVATMEADGYVIHEIRMHHLQQLIAQDEPATKE